MVHNYTGNKLDTNFIKILDGENHKQQKIMNMTEDPSEVICCLETNYIIKVNVLSIVTWLVG